jgi:hypothetical protein
LPKSLGADFDIDEKLKARIVSVQAPTGGADVVPAKYYHVLGNAFMSCLGLERCPDSILCPQVLSLGQDVAVDIYRAAGACGKLLRSEPDSKDRRPKDGEFLFRTKFSRAKEFCQSQAGMTQIESMIAAVNESDCPKDWDESRCKAALLKLQTYKVDFEWSRAQHQVGFDFAKENCPRIGQKKDPLEKSCEALKAVEASIKSEKDDFGQTNFSPTMGTK